ncbi:MAG: hypothetical protein RMZ42_03095 [Nostoc sp. DedQUE05]|uniref:hypothetical protein n=1 Tax=Nostoc sp. DedQUE05 TaxID=3075391 RepID=UPI002AD59215|nr:hypothetical protein [Nostoc sp. DedQUE05]MDZ8090919.1 hypothetical protein [Nostoc sp. DedQUE05]
MSTIYFDSIFSDEIRRKHLYDGQVFVFSPCASAIALCDFARGMVEEAFAPLDPREAQHSLPVEKYVDILAQLKPAFIHHPESKQLIQGILKESGCDLSKTYFDVPRLRTATSDRYLTAGIAYAFHPHRDTWYSAPQCQINWWIPVYDITPENAMAFHSRYWSQPVKNTSRDYDYAQWTKESRKNAAQHIKTDTRKQPHAEETLEMEPQLRLITQVGGMILFSGAQMHSTIPNTSGYTRFSIDFRTVHFDDVIAQKGAPNIDSACTGTSLGDFLRGTDFYPITDTLLLSTTNNLL